METNDPVFAPAIVVRATDTDGAYEVAIYEKAGQYGKADPRLRVPLNPLEPLEYWDYDRTLRLKITVELIIPQ